MSSPFAAPSTAGGSSDGGSLLSLSSSTTDGARATVCPVTAYGSDRGGQDSSTTRAVGSSAYGSGHGGDAAAQRTDEPAPGMTAGISRVPLPPVHHSQWQRTNASPVQYRIASAPASLAGNSPRSEQSQSSPLRTGVAALTEALAKRGVDDTPFASMPKRKALAILDAPPPIRSDMSPRGGPRRELMNTPSTPTDAAMGAGVANSNNRALVGTPSTTPVVKEKWQLYDPDIDRSPINFWDIDPHSVARVAKYGW